MKKYDATYNIIFNGVFFICFLVYSLKSINIGSIYDYAKHINMIILVCSCFLWLYNILVYRITRIKLITAAVLFVYLAISIYNQFNFFDILYFLLFYVLLNENNKSFRYVQLGGLVLILIGTILATKIGLIENLLFYRSDNGIRQTLGFAHPNTLGLFIYAITVNTLYLMSEFRHKIVKYCLLLIMNIYFYNITDSRTASFVSLTTIFIIVIFDIFNKSEKIIKNTYIIGGIILFNCIILGVSNYYLTSDIFFELNKLFTNRLFSSYVFINEFGYNMFGNDIPFIVNTSSGEVIIDSGYVNLILRKGIVFNLILFIFIFYRILRNKYTYREGILILSVFSTLMFESYGFSIFMFQILFFDYVGKRKEIK